MNITLIIFDELSKHSEITKQPLFLSNCVAWYFGKVLYNELVDCFSKPLRRNVHPLSEIRDWAQIRKSHLKSYGKSLTLTTKYLCFLGFDLDVSRSHTMYPHYTGETRKTLGTLRGGYSVQLSFFGSLTEIEWQFLYFSFLLFKLIFIGVVALQCCVSTYCIKRWISYTCTYSPSFLISFPFRSPQSTE